MGIDLGRRHARRGAVASLARSVLVTAAVLTAYFTLPMDHLDGENGFGLAIGVVLVVAVLGWELRAIQRSSVPRIRAVEALATTMVLFFTVFAAAYHLMSRAEESWFTEPLTRMDALYFTITVFATVGFGDIAPVSQTARVVTTAQMLGDLVLVGVVARMVVQAVNTGLANRPDSPVPADESPTPPAEPAPEPAPPTPPDLPAEPPAGPPAGPPPEPAAGDGQVTGADRGSRSRRRPRAR